MPPSRRDVLIQLGVASALSALAGCGSSSVPGGTASGGDAGGGTGSGGFSEGTPAPASFDFPTGTLLPFAHGVASGDPLADRVIIWTRITEVQPSAPSIPVSWLVATDPLMRNIIRRGTQTTSAARDWTVKVDVTGLAPATSYYYRFTALGAQSLIGRMRTAPATAVEEIRLAVLSCSSYWSSYWSGLGQIADRNDLDLVVHLGDYIYDFVDQDEGVRARRDEKDTAKVDYRDWLDITELRRRYALWRSDPNLLRAHQQHSWFIVWDNHDIDEDYGNELATPSMAPRAARRSRSPRRSSTSGRRRGRSRPMAAAPSCSSTTAAIRRSRTAAMSIAGSPMVRCSMSSASTARSICRVTGSRSTAAIFRPATAC